MTEERNETMQQGKKRKTRSAWPVMILMFVVALLIFALIILAGKLLKYQNHTVGVNTIPSETGYSKEQMDAEVARAVESAEKRAREEGVSEGRKTVLEYLQRELSLGNALLNTLRPLYPNELIMVSGGAYHFVPVSDTLKKHTYRQENLRVDAESGLFSYYEGEQLISHKGIDVSKHQGKIDWTRVAGDGVEFAFIRVGNRGYGSAGRLVEDEYADENMTGASQAGIPFGVYFFTQAITEEEILEEANFVLDKIKDYEVKLPVVIDVEKVTPADGRMNALSVEKRTDLVELFCKTVEQAGYRPMIYHNMETGVLMLEPDRLEQYDKWFASYSEELYYPYEYKIWQYSPKGRVDGIDTDVDLNISFSRFWEE